MRMYAGRLQYICRVRSVQKERCQSESEVIMQSWMEGKPGCKNRRDPRDHEAGIPAGTPMLGAPTNPLSRNRALLLIILSAHIVSSLLGCDIGGSLLHPHVQMRYNTVQAWVVLINGAEDALSYAVRDCDDPDGLGGFCKNSAQEMVRDSIRVGASL